MDNEGPAFSDHTVPESVCPSCGHQFSFATDTGEGHSPKPGNITLCIECGDVLLFTEELDVRWPTPDEWRAFPPELQTKINQVREVLRSIPGPEREKI